MRSVLCLTALWLVFGGMHIGLATCRVRDGLVSRHASFVGLALLGAAHALLATRLVGTVLMGGLTVFAVAGAWHQDRKLLRQRGEPYAAYLEATSTVPFGAIVAGRQRLAWQE